MRQATVLDEFQRLEAEAIWRPGPDHQRRDVVVSLGEATLTLSDLNEQVLTHWSLPAVRRLNPGATPAVYSPGTDAPDTLEVRDAEMNDALTRVSKAIGQRRAHPGRLRTAIFVAVFVILSGSAIFWLPGATSRYAASILPDTTRISIGESLLREVSRVAGAPCGTPDGLQALERLESALFEPGNTKLTVLPSALTGTAHLPGGVILVDHRLVEDAETQDLLIAMLRNEDVQRRSGDPVEALLHDLGLRATFRLLTTGEIGQDTLADHAQKLVASSSLDPVSAVTLPNTASVLSDGDWIALQQICED